MEADGVVVGAGGEELDGAVGDADGVGDGGGGEGALGCFEGAGAGGGVFVGDVGCDLAGRAVDGVPVGGEGADGDVGASHGCLGDVERQRSVRAVDVEAGGDECDVAGSVAASVVELDVALSTMFLDDLRELGLKHGDGVCAGQVYTRKCVRQLVGRE